MKIFVIEWRDQHQMKYHREYFSSIVRASGRYEMISKDIPESDPWLETVLVDTYEDDL